MKPAVEVGVAAFLGLPGADDEGLRARLLAVGLEVGCVERLLVWLPVAFGRRWLTGAVFPEDYSDGGTRRPLKDDPVWVACEARAASASRDEVEAIGLRSADVQAVNAWLASNPPDPDLSRLAFALALPQALPPLVPGDGGAPDPADTWRALVTAHGHAPEALGADARLFPRFTPDRFWVQVDYVFAHPTLAGGQQLESFAGFGPTVRAAISDTVRKFTTGSVHVLLTALLDARCCPEQVDLEDWPHPSGVRRLVSGPQLQYGTGAEPLGPLIDGLRAALALAPLDEKVHTLRVFTLRDGARIFADEVLLDGADWAEGLAVLRAFSFAARQGTWGVRWFGILTR